MAEQEQTTQMTLKDYLYIAKVKESTQANVYMIIEALKHCDTNTVAKAAGFETAEELDSYLTRCKYLGSPAPRKKTMSETVELDIVFDGPPGHLSGVFVEVQNSNTGKSVSSSQVKGLGKWYQRDDGYWVLPVEVVA